MDDEYVRTQLKIDLACGITETMCNVIIACKPIRAIAPEKTATAAQTETVYAVVRGTITLFFRLPLIGCT